ncbi:flippase [Halorubrum sp. SS5]|nr:flippase [Halorubrum sp. SS5]
MNLGRETASLFVSHVTNSLAGFVATFAIARVLGAEGVGVYALGVATMTWLMIPINGVQRGLTKRISEGIDPGSYLVAGILIHVVLGGIITTALLVLSEYVNRYIGVTVAGLLAAMYFGNTLFKGVGAALEGEKKVARYGWLRALERIVRTVLQVGLILAGFTVSSLFLGHAISLMIASAIGGLLIGPWPAVPRVRHFWRLVDFAKYSWLGGMKGKTFGWMDTIVLGFFVGSSLIGIYEVAWALASVLMLVANSVRSTLFPELSELSTDDREERIHHYLNEGIVFTGIFLIPGFFGGIAVGSDLLRIYRPEFTQGATVLVILIAARTFDAYGTQFVSAINAVDRPEIAFRVNGAFVAVNLVLNVTLIARYGWQGAAVATLISGIVSLILGYRALSGLIGRPKVPFEEIFRQVVAGVIMFFAVVIGGRILPENHLATIVLIGGGAVVYGGILFAISTRIRQKALSTFEFR